ncbi:uncharacterized protein LOC144559947 [Carex rostrata]
MGDKVYTLAISVDLSCCRCRHAIQEYLCQLQRERCNRIVAIVYEDKNNVVLVSGPFDPEQLKRKLLCKFPKIINSIDIREPPKPKPPPDECKEKFMKKCLEKYEKIRECTEKCKKECEEKCWTECKKKILCKCKRKCDCKCKCKCDCDCEKKPVCPEPPKTPVCPERPKPPVCPQPPKPPVCPQPPKPPVCPQPPKPPVCPCPPMPPVCPCPPMPPVCPRPPLVVCCPRPCPCFTPWSNSFRCCSCGVECSPGMCGPGWGSGPSPWGRPQWGNCESSQPRNIICESTAPPCSIM